MSVTYPVMFTLNTHRKYLTHREQCRSAVYGLGNLLWFLYRLEMPCDHMGTASHNWQTETCLQTHAVMERESTATSLPVLACMHKRGSGAQAFWSKIQNYL